MPSRTPTALYVGCYHGAPQIPWLGATRAECRTKMLAAFRSDIALDGTAWDAFARSRHLTIVPATLHTHAPSDAARRAA